MSGQLQLLKSPAWIGSRLRPFENCARKIRSGVQTLVARKHGRIGNPSYVGKICSAVHAFVALIVVAAGLGRADDLRPSLIIEGGGLPPYCPALEKLVEAAKVDGRIRIGYFPTASSNPVRSAARFVQRLSLYGVRPEQIQIIDLTVKNSAVQARDPAVLTQIRDCTAIFLGGGDQTRITRALLNPDGTPTAALKAIDAVRQAGGVIAGTSAGAAAQSETMISISGFPDDSIDDGMDALDFGLTKSIEQPARRGLLVTRGLGFFRHGIVDQHFSQYRGRLGRLARATIEEQIRFGFGIDEDAALVVAANGIMEILGPGCVTIIDAAGATCKDGSLGCSITGVHLTCLGHGDRFDPATGRATIHPDKKQHAAGQEDYNGNFPIPDIAGRGALLQSMIDGLGNNTSRTQIGITLKHYRHYGHGYRLTFSKTDQTRGYEGIVNGLEAVAVTRVRLDIEPVALTLRHPETGLPLDLPQEPSRKRLAAISFRGIMLADDQGRFRPNQSITRGELASAIAQTIRLELPRGKPSEITDVLDGAPAAHEIALVAAAGLMPTEDGRFRPTELISRQQAATVLVRLAEQYRSEISTAKPATFADSETIVPEHRQAVLAAHQMGLLKEDSTGIRPTMPLTREEAAEAIYTIIGFTWTE